jgi:hypothetical protein
VLANYITPNPDVSSAALNYSAPTSAVVSQLDASNKTTHLTFQPSLLGLSVGRNQLRDSTGSSIIQCKPDVPVSSETCGVKDSLRNVPLTFTFASEPAVTQSYSFPLFCLSEASFTPGLPDPACPSSRIALPVTGDTRHFPFDSYQVAEIALVRAQGIDLTRLNDEAMSVSVGQTADRWDIENTSSFLKVVPSLTYGPPFTQPNGQPTTHTLTAPTNTATVTDTVYLGMTFSLHRTLSMKIYTMGLAVFPLLLAGALAHRLYTRVAEQNSLEFFVALAATALAILPVRAVLVPTELSGPTLVDGTLAIGVAVLVTLGIWKYVYDLAHVRQHEPRSAPKPTTTKKPRT